MIRGTETLLHRHFGRLLQDPHVEILDPAVGTGTFICDLIEHLKGNPAALKHKYQNEIHCNEVAILPYYIANLNIEFTYAQLTGEYLEFPHICFVDTLDNLGFEKTHRGQNMALDFGLSAEHIERIVKQNKRRISVILGNPPYNANQMNENDNNKNRLYGGIDARIKDTWIAASHAQKTKMYDMYARFFRWAADRIDADGIIAFVTNRSFIDSRTFDGFRSEMAKEFDEAWIVDLGGDVRANSQLSGTTHNVFGIQTGVTISFWVKRHKEKKQKHACTIWYARRPEMETAEEKLAWLSATKLDDVEFVHVTPDAKSNWINLADNDFDSLLPLCSKETKAAATPNTEKSLFKLYSLGISTNRDEWVYGEDREALATKMHFFLDLYEQHNAGKEHDTEIKWSRNLKRRFEQDRHEAFSAERMRPAIYRPFVLRWLYDSTLFIDEAGAKAEIFPVGCENVAIYFSDKGARTDYVTLAANCPGDLHLGASIDAYQSVSLYRYDDAGNRVDNITDWGVKQFEKRYGKRAKITRQDIFHYVYAVLHDPAYREKYALNLKRELPRIPLHDDFEQWANWGRQLMELHVGFEGVAPTPLERREQPGFAQPKAKLKADEDAGLILLDEATTLAGIPRDAWNYRLGNRSALEWVLDQHKESQPRDPTIREKFNTYRFADYKEHVIDLLGRVCAVSVATMEIIKQMAQGPTQGQAR
jgi:predicted helicase